MSREITLRLEGRPPTPNDRLHWRQIAHEAAKWKEAAWKSTLAQMPADFGPPMERCELEIVFVLPTRARRDWDNLQASTKALTDGIVSAKVIVDDSIDVIARVTYGWRLERGLSATVFTFREIDDRVALGL